MNNIQSITEKQLKSLLKRKGVYGRMSLIKVDTVYLDLEIEEGEQIKKEIAYVVVSRHKRILKVIINYLERRYSIETLG